MKLKRAKIEPGRKSRVFVKQLVSINTEVRRYYKGRPGRADRKPRVKKDDLKYIFDRAKGRCRECGYPLTLQGQTVCQEARFQFIKPLKNGGAVIRENLMLVCSKCKDTFRCPERMLKRIPEVNTIADLIERLMVETHRAQIDPLHRSIVSALKRDLNSAIEEAMDMLHYRPLVTSLKFDPPVFVENKNTLADTMEKLGEKVIEKKDTTGERDQLEVDLQGVMKEQRYRILSE